MIFRRFFSVSTLSVHNSSIVFPIAGKSIPFKISENTTIGDLHSLFESYKSVRIESLEGISIAKTTFFYELLGASIIVTIDNNSYKIFQNRLETPIEKLAFLVDNHEVHPEKRHIMHKFLRKCDKIIEPSTSYSKEAIAVLLDQIISKKPSKHHLTNQDLSKTLETTFNELESLKPIHDKISQKAKSSTFEYLWTGFGITVAQLLYIGSGTYYYYSWDVMEAQAYLIGIGNFITGLWVFSKYNINFNQLSVFTAIYESQLKALAKKENFDLENYYKLLDKLKEYQGLITLENTK